MATVKIDTAVDNEEFDKFLASFKKYQEAFAKQPDVWGAVAGSAEDANKSFAEAADSMRGLADSMDSVLGRSRGLEDTTKKTVSYWERLTRATKLVAVNVLSTTASIASMGKWAAGAALTGGLAVAAGGAGLYGMDVLGNAVARQRSSAMGLGTTYGGLASARVNYARFGDADATLARIRAAQTDPSNKGRLGFQTLGIENYKTRDSADVLAELLEKGGKYLDNTPQDLLAPTLQNSGLGDLLSLNEAQRIRGHAGEASGMAGRMRSDRPGLELDEGTQRKMQDFVTQLGLAGKQIETVLVNRLSALAPGLNGLSAAVTHLATEALKKDSPVSQWLGELNTGIENLAHEIDKPEFQTKVKNFMHGVADVAVEVYGFGKKIAQLAHWLADLVGSDDAAPGLTPLATGTPGERYGLGGRGPTGLRAAALGMPSGRSRPGFHGGPGARGNWWTDDHIRHAYDRLVAGGLSPLEAEGQIARMAYIEAPGGPTASNNIGGGHFGIYQASRDRQAHFGGSADFDDQLDGIISEKKTSEARSHKLGLAAKDAFDAAVAASAFERAGGYDPATGMDNYTRKTEAGIPAIHKIVTARPPTKVTIQKNTGGNPVVSAAAMAAPP